MISEKSNNILTLVLKNGETTSLSFPSGKDIESALELALKFEGIKKEDVKKYFFSIDSEKNLEDFNYFNGEKEEIDEIEQSIAFKVDEVRRQRDVLFKKLDLQFMRSIEDDDNKSEKEHIILIKNFLRDLPSDLNKKLKEYDNPKDIVFFDPYNNIFEIMLVHPGKGYEKPPTVSIAPPNGDHKGFQIEAVSTISDGEVKDIIVTQYGSGYTSTPDVLVSPPEDTENGECAMAVILLTENNF